MLEVRSENGKFLVYDTDTNEPVIEDLHQKMS